MVDTNVILGAQTPDVVGGVSRGLGLGQQIQQAPMQNALLKQQVQSGQNTLQMTKMAEQALLAQQHAQTLLGIQDPAQRQAVHDQFSAQMKAQGFQDDGQPDDLSNQGLQNIISQTTPIVNSAQQMGILGKGYKSPDPYYTNLQTSTGIYRMNARTGELQKIMDSNGNPVLPVSADPNVQGRVSRAKSSGSAQGTNAEKFQNQADTWDVNKAFLIDSVPEIKNILQQTPSSSLSNATQRYLSGIVGNTDAANAQAEIEQFGAMFLQGMPYPPGAQSDKEQQARAQVLSEQLTNPNLNPKTKIKLLGNFIDWQDSKAKQQRKKAEQLRAGKPTPQQHTSSGGITFTVQ